MKLTAMQSLVELLKVNDIYKECMPYVLEIIDEVYLPMEQEQISNGYMQGFKDCYLYHISKSNMITPKNGEEYYNETYKNEA